MLTQLVVTGRSRVALYLARIPAGLAIVVPMVAVAFTIICAVCELAVAHLEPNGGGFVYGVEGGPGMLRDASRLLPESTTVAVVVIAAWLVGRTVLGAWRMTTRDA